MPHIPLPHLDSAFSFESYMRDRAVMVNKALDEAVPLVYPEQLTESMR
jgi:geranylgeranyl diphosphate synthase type II